MGLAVGLLLGLGIGAWYGRRPATAREATTRREAEPPRSMQADAARSSLAHAPARSLPEDIARLRRWVEGEDAELTRAQAGEIVRRWAATDAAAALGFVAGAKRFPDREAALAIPLAALARRDVRGVIAWIQQYGTEEQRGHLATRVIDQITRDDPGAALEVALADHMPVGMRQFSRILDTMMSRDPAEALRGLARLSPEGQNMAARGLFRTWYEKDPAAVLEWLNGQNRAAFYGPALGGVLAAAAHRGDPAVLRSLMERFKPSPSELRGLVFEDELNAETQLTVLQSLSGQDRTRAIAQFVRENLEGSPEGMLHLVTSLLPPAARADALEMGFRQWLRSDRPAALNWLAGLQDPVLAQGLRTELERIEARANPEAYLRQMEAHTLSPGDGRRSATALMVWAREDPAAAAAWLTRNVGRVLPDAAENVAAEYVRRDPAGGTAWIAGLPKGPVQDAALAAAADSRSRRGDIEGATDSVNAIGDSSRRVAAMYSVFSALVQKDQGTALRWAEEQGLAEETRLSWMVIAEKNGHGDLIE